jgi:hypothetical protein
MARVDGHCFEVVSPLPGFYQPMVEAQEVEAVPTVGEGVVIDVVETGFDVGVERRVHAPVDLGP